MGAGAVRRAGRPGQRAGRVLASGLSWRLVILSNGGDDTGRQHREAQIPQTGLFYSAARFRIIEGSPAPAEWLEVFETDDSHPLHAYPRVTSITPPASQIQPQLSQSFRLRACPAARQ